MFHTEKILAMNREGATIQNAKSTDLRNGDKIYHEKTTFIGLLLMLYWLPLDVRSNSNSKTQSGKLKISEPSFRFMILQEILWG